MIVYRTPWIYVVQTESENKTKCYEVRAVNGEDTLGHVSFLGRWRKFVFFPCAGTLYDHKCLNAIADFCEIESKAWRESLKAQLDRTK